MKKVLLFGLIFALVLPIFSYAFSFEYVQQGNYTVLSQAGFLDGLWHGLIAPYSLIVRLLSYWNPVFSVGMYAYENTGWFYDLGFLLGVSLSFPAGWIAAIIAAFALFV